MWRAVTRNRVEGKFKHYYFFVPVVILLIKPNSSGQYGVCVINMEPLEEGSGVEFVSEIKGGVISKPFISSVEKGVREQLELGGPLAGYPVTDVRVVLIDGKMHSVDSNDFAFTSAGKLGVKAALSKAGSRLLQPMEKVNFQVSEKLVGEIRLAGPETDHLLTLGLQRLGLCIDGERRRLGDCRETSRHS